MKYNLNERKKAVFLMAAMLVLNTQAKENKEVEISTEYETQENEVVKSITVTTEVVTEDTITQLQETTTDQTVITFEDGSVEVEQTGTVEQTVAQAHSIEQLADMINKDHIITSKQLLAACKKFPELQEIIIRFIQEGISDTPTALMKFGTVKNPTTKKYIISLVTKIKNKDKLWNIIKN